MRRVIVTGATSMIGVALIKCCIERNVEILAIVRKDTKKLKRMPNSDLLSIIECNLEDLDSIQAGEKKYEIFYHFAWGDTSKVTRDDPVLQEKNILYTLKAVELAKRLGCKKFIGAGSQAEYGVVHHVITAETQENPLLSYGIAKAAAGRLSRKLCEKYGIVHIWGRVFSVYGKNDSKETMISYAIQKFISKDPAFFSSATQYWDYLFEDDAGKIFYLIGEKVCENKIYRIASGQSKPLKEYIIELKDIFGEDLVYKFAEATNEKNVVSLQVEVSDLMEDIGYSPQITFKEGAEKIIKYWKQVEK